MNARTKPTPQSYSAIASPAYAVMFPILQGVAAIVSIDRILLAGRMRRALNDAYCALTDDAACHLAYLAAGITQYSAEDHERAVTYARLWREQPSNISKQLRAA